MRKDLEEINIQQEATVLSLKKKHQVENYYTVCFTNIDVFFKGGVVVQKPGIAKIDV